MPDKPRPVEERSVHWRVDELVKIIGQERARVDLIKTAIAAFDKLRKAGLPEYWYRPTTTPEKDTVRNLVRALERVERLLGRTKEVQLMLDRALWGSNDGEAFGEWRKQLKQFRERFDAFASWPLGKPRPHAAKFRVKHEAVRAAAELLKAHGVPLSKSAFCNAAAVLYGDRDAKLEHFEHYCRGYKARKGRPPPDPAPGRLTGLLAPARNRIAK